MDKKDLCLCSHCRKVYAFSEARQTKRLIYGMVQIPEIRCPYCNTRGYTSLKDLEYFNKKAEKERIR